MKINAYKEPNHPVKIEQTQIQRDWMDATDNRHAYKCFPVSLANTIGYSISFLEDIEFIWNGISNSYPSNVNILKGDPKICNTNRGNATISFNTGIYFKTDQDVSMLSICPPNYFIDGASAMTYLISTSFYQDSFPAAWRITKANEKIVIPAGFPVATLIPISLKSLNTVELDIHEKVWSPDYLVEIDKRNKEWKRISQAGGFTNFYRDAVSYDGTKIGEHETKSIRLKINDFTEKNK